jgi:hypothetical protein
MELNSSTEFYLIEYPGIIVNLENALRTLGGKDAIHSVSF